MRDEKEERSKQGQTNNKAKQHSTPKAVTLLKKNELPRVGLKPTTLYTLDGALYYQGSSASWAQISHLIVHLMNRLTINQLSMKEKAGVMKPPTIHTYTHTYTHTQSDTHTHTQ